MTTDEQNTDPTAEESEKDAPGSRQEHETGTKTMDPKTAAAVADMAAERAESEARDGRTEP